LQFALNFTALLVGDNADGKQYGCACDGQQRERDHNAL
jgi:hypothetical protein